MRAAKGGVSLTITEGGYNISDITGEFDAANPDVVRDLEQGAVPRTTFGLVTEALNRRKKRGLDPFTVMSCDNLQGNGHLTRAAFATFARLRDPELADWVKREVCFPDSIVDRITPTTTDAARAEVRDRFGIDDRWPVVREPCTQWVLQDAFAGRPPAVRRRRGTVRESHRVHRDRDLFGDLADHERFVTAYRSALASLHERGGTDDAEVASLMITA